MNLNVEEYGTGQPIVFIHGVGGSSQYWYFQREYLKNRMKVILIDLPGHGRSTGNGITSIEEGRDAVLNVILKKGIRQPYIVGHSMGGGIALSLATTQPELFKGLALICTGAKLRVLPAILDGVMKDKETIVRMIMMEYAFSKKAPQKMKENGFRDMMNSSAEVIYQGFMACHRFSAVGSLNRISHPVLIIAGRDDLLTPPSYSEYLHREIKGSDLVIVDDAGHMVMIEQPDAVNRALENFVSRQ